MNDKSAGIFGCLLMLLICAYGFAQVWAGYTGIEHHLGVGWAFAAGVVAFLFRFSLPLTIGAFFCAMNVWGWHWIGALLFAAPGLLFMALMIPGVLAGAIQQAKR